MNNTTDDGGGFQFTVSADLAVTATQTVASVFLMFIVGILIAWYPRHESGNVYLSGLLPQAVLRPVARMATFVLVPCLGFVSLGSQLSVSIVKEAWPMILWTPVHMITSAVIVFVLFKVFPLHKQYFVEFSVGSVFTNAVGIPIVMAEVLCAQGKVAETEGEECFERASSFIFIPIISWMTIYWTVGLSAIRHIHSNEYPRMRQMVLSLLNPPLLAAILAIVVGVLPPVQDFFFSDRAPAAFVASSMRVFGNSSVGIMSLLMAVTLGKSLGGPQKTKRMFFGGVKALFCCSRGTPSRVRHDESVANGRESTATILTVGDALADEQQEKPQPLRETMDKETDVGMNSSTSTNAKNGEKEWVVSEAPACHTTQLPRTQEEVTPVTEKCSGKWSTATLAAYVLLTMVVLPCVRLALLFTLGSTIFDGPNRKLILLVLAIQSLPPTANLVIVVLQQEGASAIAERLSRACLLQYFVGVATLLVFTAVAVGFIYGE